VQQSQSPPARQPAPAAPSPRQLLLDEDAEVRAWATAALGYAKPSVGGRAGQPATPQPAAAAARGASPPPHRIITVGKPRTHGEPPAGAGLRSSLDLAGVDIAALAATPRGGNAADDLNGPGGADEGRMDVISVCVRARALNAVETAHGTAWKVEGNLVWEVEAEARPPACHPRALGGVLNCCTHAPGPARHAR